MNELPQFVLVGPIGVCGVETGGAAAAQPAESVVVERMTAQKRGPALDAIVFGVDGLGLFEAGGANRDSRKLPQGPDTDPAIVREDQRKQVGGRFLGEQAGALERKGRGSRVLSKPTTAEDSPPEILV
jgi:hypothetical protein